MPGPPPPPPPGMMPPPPPAPISLPKAAKPDDRAALLKSIQKGARLKKTVTNDRSAPIIGGKTSNNNSNSSSPSSLGGTPTSTTPNGLNLGGLFAGGIPKLKPTGKLGAMNQNNPNNNEQNAMRKLAIPQQPMKNSSSLQNELKKQLASDNKNRGPPPPAPVRNVRIPEENGSRQLPPLKIGSTNGLHLNQSSLHSNLQPQNSTLYRKVKNNANLSTLDSPEPPINGYNQPHKPVINHGKPNLAPKPPVLNAKPFAPPKKLLVNGKPVSRAHSMKSPRSPSPQSPDATVPLKFGTVRNLSSVISQSLANSTGNLSPRPRPIINGRPNAPPPSIPSQQPAPPPPPPHANQPPLPPSKTNIVKPPNHAPPPPPSVLPQPPNHTPPPPPHRMLPSRAPPAVPNNNFAPPPPPRHSSMTSTRKAAIDLEEKYKSMFHDPSTFPKPPPYRNIFKVYGGRQAINKQQAPQPPNIQSTSRTWDASSAC